MRYISIFPQYPVSILKMEELKRYRQKVINDQVTVSSIVRMLNNHSPIMKTVNGHYVNKSFIVGVRDYDIPANRRSSQAKYERRNQINLYVSMDLSTMEEVSGIISVQKIASTVEACMERALAPCDPGRFIGVLTDWNTTEKLDNMIDPRIQKELDEANLSQSFFAVNRNMIKKFSLVREMGDESIEKLIQPSGKVG
ncbi:MAG: hypothetical protein RRA15_00775 [bacterium]|nr:hypothetical protein [bacterium]MDT8365009.1 hypothetical protein [bacterium]